MKTIECFFLFFIVFLCPFKNDKDSRFLTTENYIVILEIETQRHFSEDHHLHIDSHHQINRSFQCHSNKSLMIIVNEQCYYVRSFVQFFLDLSTVSKSLSFRMLKTMSSATQQRFITLYVVTLLLINIIQSAPIVSEIDGKMF